MKKILLIRTYKSLGAGGPVPPLGLLYIAAAIKEAFADQYEIKIIDSGTGGFTLETLKDILWQFRPDFIGISTLSCEADLLKEIASSCKTTIKDCKIIVGGPHATACANTLLSDQNIDIAVIGEGEKTIVELLKSLDGSFPIDAVNGIAFRKDNKNVVATSKEFIETVDRLPFPAWDLIDLKEYIDSPNWNGIPKEHFYFPILTSRGCPYQCTYCHNIFGKRVRSRSPGNVVNEIEYLFKRYGVKEFHIIDDAFNYDALHAKSLCSAIINSGLKVSLAFPNGLRADNIDDELVALLKKAGTYKINFGFETAIPRLQSLIKKRLDINSASDAVHRVSKAGIITGGYFMFGFPTETREDILKTIDFASKSELDVAYFFKVTPYPGSELYDYINNHQEMKTGDNFNTLHFYSIERSYSKINTGELNDLLLLAQQKFYLNFKRFIKGLSKSSNKRSFIGNAFDALGLLIQSYILRKLNKSATLL
ncbi:MAG: radical SAM protein [Candidatus Omnitrophica bacterium]|nr:radical SAM protein [Candidatus Omnitrophota bacterium]